MLHRSLKYLIESKDQYIANWFFWFSGDLISITTMDEKFIFSIVYDEKTEITSWSDFDIISELENDTRSITNSTLAAWSLCRFFDRSFETDDLLRDFVKSETGMTIEHVPFTVEKGNLSTICELNFCKGTQKNSKNASLLIDKDRLLVILPSTNATLRQLFFKRLRRISS